MEILNLRHATIGPALAQLKADVAAEHGIGHYINPDELGTLFEQKYNCIIMAADAYCTEGHLIFEDDQYRTLFLLRFSGVPDADKHTQ